jgi:hypothetical protein
MNEAGGLICSARLSEGLAGVAVLHALVSGLIDGPAEVLICTETDRGLFVGANGEVQRHARNLNPEPASAGNLSFRPESGARRANRQPLRAETE